MRITLIKPAAATAAVTLLILASAKPVSVAATDAPAASASMDPCSLVSAAEARSILGVDVSTPVSGDDGLMRHCVYSSADKRKSLTLEAKATDRAVFERWMKLHGSAVPQLGSDAYTNAGTLLVWKNGTQVNVKISDQSGNRSAEQLEIAQEKAASVVLPRL